VANDFRAEGPNDGTAPLTREAKEAAFKKAYEELNAGQRAAFDKIVASFDPSFNPGAPPELLKKFFVEGEGGTGKFI